jgi:hypothetical protein
MILISSPQPLPMKRLRSGASLYMPAIVRMSAVSSYLGGRVRTASNGR